VGDDFPYLCQICLKFAERVALGCGHRMCIHRFVIWLCVFLPLVRRLLFRAAFAPVASTY
jgi:hypothetical protein